MKAIFIHHSTGANLLHQGKVRKILKEKRPEIELWDKGYNWTGIIAKIKTYFSPCLTGLRDGNGIRQKDFIDIPDNNTDPDGYEKLFLQDYNDSDTALHKVLQFDVIIFKSCYPVTAIKSDEQLEDYKKNYLNIRNTIDKFPNKTFVIMTPPPLRKERTKPEWASRARLFTQWLQSDEYLGNRKNVKIFDFFDFLSDKEGANANMLKREYCRIIPWDCHPNKIGNKNIIVNMN